MASPLTRSAVRIYGALSALGNETGNVLEGLLPFFDPILRKHDGSKLNPDVVALEIRQLYKWNFNSDLVEVFVPYLKGQGWIVADISNTRDSTYTIKMPKNNKLDSSMQTIEAELRGIATQFKEFSESLSPLTTIPRQVEEFEDMLIEWLLYIEAFSEESIDFKVSVRPDQTGTLRNFYEVPKTTSLRDEEKFLCARFVKHAIEEEQSSAEILARIAAIGLLTEVVQDFVKPVTAVDRTNLIVYLDAPVAMELLGVSGKLARENIAPLIAELIRIGASVRIFGQSIDEIRNSLQAMLQNYRPTGPTAEALMRQEVLKEYVVEASLNPAPLLEALGVKTKYQTLEQTPSEHQYFNIDEWRNLYSSLSFADNPHAREHDTNITAFTMRQRHGKTSSDIFKSHAIVLTRNGLLAQIVRRTCVEKIGMPDEIIPPVIHRRVLATAMWLRTGMGAGDLNIPKRMLLASCEQVLSIRPNVIEAVRRLTNALGDEDKVHQLDLLISQDRSARALMDKTLGATNVVTEVNLPILWQEMLHPHLEEERLKGIDAVKEARAEAKKQLFEAKERIETVTKEGEKQAALLSAKLERKRQEDREAVVALCLDVEHSLGRKRRIRCGIGLAIGLICSLPLIFETTPLVRTISLIFGWLFAYLTITGGKLIGTTTNQTQALSSLRSTAEDRRLVGKLDQFSIEWDKTIFVVTDRAELRSTPNPGDLLSIGSADK